MQQLSINNVNYFSHIIQGTPTTEPRLSALCEALITPCDPQKGKGEKVLDSQKELFLRII